MYLTIRQQTEKLSQQNYRILRKLSLSYNENYKLLKSSQNYKILKANMAQQIIREVDGMFQSFFALLQKKKEDNNFSVKVRLPGYLPKNGFTTLIISIVRLKGNIFTMPYSRTLGKTHKAVTITIPPILQSRKVKEIRIIPKDNARFFEIQYIYEVAEEQRELDTTKALAIDLGINNLATCVTTNRQRRLARNRNNRVNDYLSKATKYIINYCLREQISVIVCGHNADFQFGANLERITNQNFMNIPFGKLRNKLQYLCKLYGIRFVEQEESHTSKASFGDMDELPVYTAGNADVHNSLQKFLTEKK